MPATPNTSNAPKTASGLSQHRFPSVYETGRSDLVSEFYTPCLTEAVEYCRAVGFFSSALLPLISQGLEHFVERHGRMRLIISPILSAEDVAAIEQGYRERKDISGPLGIALERNLEELHRLDGLRAAVSNLAWLVRNGIIDVKVAVPIKDGEVLRGVYHEKLGYFRDSRGSVVAFQGSPNETEFAVWANFESLWVCTSWESDPPPQHLTDILRMFEERWTDATPGLLVVNFPEAPRAWLLQRAREALEFPPPLPPSVAVRPAPRPYQTEALEAWIARGRRGILAMATGTGKTYVALTAIEQELMRGRSVIVAVPTRALRSQWDRETRKFLPDAAVLQLSSNTDLFEPGVIEACLAGPRPTVVIAVTNTLVHEDFLRRAERCLRQRQFSVVVDEVHHVGSDARSGLLRLECEHRLGLSATPERSFDEEGNAAIRAYFGDVVFRFDIGDAIQRGVLTPYRYYPEPIALTPRESAEYEQLGQRIVISTQRLARELHIPTTLGPLRILEAAWKAGLTDSAAGLTALLQQRADITKKAQEKIPLVTRVLGVHKALRRVLVYCDDKEQLSAVRESLIAAGVETVQYVGEMDEGERADAIRAIDGGAARIVLSMRCLDEGVDIPSCDGAIILASSKTWREFVQRRGRVLRLYRDKPVATIVDPIVLPVVASEASVAMVESELRRSCVFIRDAVNRATGEAIARKIALAHHIDFDEVSANARNAL
jgi:superfamily II DNA or RNA helicase